MELDGLNHTNDRLHGEPGREPFWRLDVKYLQIFNLGKILREIFYFVYLCKIFKNKRF